MKINKFLLPLFSIILLTSCSNVNYHIDDLTFDECNLYLKDFSEVSGHCYKYKSSELNKEFGNKCLDLYKHIANSNFNKIDASDAQGFEGIMWYSVQFKGEYYSYLQIDSENNYNVRLNVNITPPEGYTVENNETLKNKIYSYSINDENTKKMIDDIVPTFESILSNIEWTIK